MAPNAKSTNPDGQKTLFSFFKPKDAQATKTTSSASEAQSVKPQPRTVGAVAKDAPKAKSAQVKMRQVEPKTPPRPSSSDIELDGDESVIVPPSSPSAALSVRSFSSSSGVSVASSNGMMRSSDAIDVDMFDDDEEVVVRPTRLKRKVAVIDEDSEPDVDLDSFAKNLANKSFTGKGKGKEPAAKSRPTKKRRTSSAHSDDDDFIVPSEEEDDPFLGKLSEEDIPSPEADGSEEEQTTKPKKRSTAKKAVSKPARPSLGGTKMSSTGSGATFLTRAEQRAQDVKQDKKESDECFSFLKDVRDKDGHKPDDPDYDPRTLYVPKSAWAQFTPFEKQFWEIKQNHYDTVLFFQKGKFFELYEEDAFLGAREFDLKLTHRVKMSMVGVPEMSFNYWASKFLAHGYKVGRVDQAETALGAEMRQAATKGKKEIVRRELHKVFTNGTIIDGELLMDEQAGHCIAIRELGDNEFGVCILDSSTSEFNLSAFEDDPCRTKLETVFRKLRPKEIIFHKGNLSVPTVRLLKNILPGSCQWTGLRDSEGYDFDTTIEELNKLYPSEDGATEMADEGQILISGVPEAIRDMVSSRMAVEALGVMMWYLTQLNISEELLSMKNFNVYDPMRRGQGLMLDGQTLAHIEVLINDEGSEEGSLLKLLSRCVTPFGKRLFRIWLCMPLLEVKAINDRLDAVEGLMNHPTFESDFNKLAKGLPDLERIISRIHAKNCKVQDFVKILDAFKRINEGFKDMADTAASSEISTIAGLLRGAPDLTQHIENVESQFTEVDETSNILQPQDGKDETYDEIQAQIADIEKELKQELKALEKKAGGPLSYWHSSLGTKDIYVVEVPTGKGKKGANSGAEYKIPKSWTKNGGTQALTRYNVPDIAPQIRALKEARETRTGIIKDFKDRVYASFDTDRDIWLSAVKVMAELDCLFSLAKSSSALGEPSCRPELVESEEAFVEFEELRHPALMLKEKTFIPNDVKMGKAAGEGAARVMLLTGPNMGGKSTMMRMTAAGVIMAQLGMYVPAAKARLSPVDAILTRMGAYDNMFQNSSTFKVEMDECCKILKEASPRSLIIMDELGRGTSTFDGMAIAGAVLYQLATHTLALSCFATHYSSLTDDFAYHPEVRNMHMETAFDEENRELVFLYKLVAGAASSSFGTHVASLAGVPLDVVQRAEKLSTDFAAQFKTKMSSRKIDALPVSAQADFAFLAKVAQQGVAALSDNPVRRKETLNIIRKAIGMYTAAI